MMPTTCARTRTAARRPTAESATGSSNCRSKRPIPRAYRVHTTSAQEPHDDHLPHPHSDRHPARHARHRAFVAPLYTQRTHTGADMFNRPVTLHTRKLSAVAGTASLSARTHRSYLAMALKDAGCPEERAQEFVRQVENRGAQRNQAAYARGRAELEAQTRPPNVDPALAYMPLSAFRR